MNVTVVQYFLCLCETRSRALPGAVEASADKSELQLGSDGHGRGRGKYSEPVVPVRYIILFYYSKTPAFSVYLRKELPSLETSGLLW